MYKDIEEIYKKKIHITLLKKERFGYMLYLY